MNVVHYVIERYGSAKSLSIALNVSAQCISKWRKNAKIPASRLVEIELLTGIERNILDPELFGGYHKIGNQRKDLDFAIVIMAANLLEQARINRRNRKCNCRIKAHMLSLHKIATSLNMNNYTVSMLLELSNILDSKDLPIPTISPGEMEYIWLK